MTRLPNRSSQVLVAFTMVAVLSLGISQAYAVPGTTLTVNCSPTSVDLNGVATTVISGTLTKQGGGAPVSGKTITLSYSPDGTTWTNIGTATTDSNGAYTYSWTVPHTVPNGLYAIRATFAGDGSYGGSSATTSGGGNLLVVPEYQWGALLALTACFVAFAVFKKSGSLFHKRQKSL